MSSSSLSRNSGRSACKAWDWDGEVDLASIWYSSHWNGVKTLVVSLKVYHSIYSKVVTGSVGCRFNRSVYSTDQFICLQENTASGTSAGSVWLGAFWFRTSPKRWSDGSDDGYYNWFSSKAVFIKRLELIANS